MSSGQRREAALRGDLIAIRARAAPLYEKTYCARDEMENRNSPALLKIAAEVDSVFVVSVRSYSNAYPR